MNDCASAYPIFHVGRWLMGIRKAQRASGSRALPRHAFQGWQMPVCLVVALYLLVSDLTLFLPACGLTAPPHGYFNLDCLLIGIAGLFLPRGAVFLLLCLDTLAAFADSICATYLFSMRELLSSLRYLPLLPRGRLTEGIAVLTAGFLICAALALVRPRSKKRIQLACALLACFVLSTSIDVFDGQNLLWRQDVVRSSFRLAHSPAFTLLAREVHAYRTNAASRSGSNAPMPSASSRAISFLDDRRNGTEPPNVVLILVESWGMPLDAHLAGALTAAYDDPRLIRKYDIAYGTAPFTGLTVPGEARELCHSTAGFGIMHLSTEEAGQCLPAWFHARGYENLAIHGYLGQMFYRSNWYPKLGFDRMWFNPDLIQMGLPNCRGAFPGSCDASIAGWIESSLLAEDRDKPKFIYWVTLNSHLPVPANPDLPDDGMCKGEPELQDSAALCSWFRLVRSVHQSVAQMALGASGRPTVFLLVGDHAPPFSSPRLRAKFSATEVPYVMLTPAELSRR
ncbi:MAG: sulfatase-like hydrolase/transferase [Terracidiphilus sp.]|jgi:hypothetical protein